MLEVKVTITLAPEVMSLIKGLVGGICIPTKEVGHAPIQIPVQKDTPADTEQKEEVKSPVEDETDQEESTITVEELRAITAKAAKKDKAAVKEILAELGAKSVSTLDKKHYQAFYDKVKELA